MSTNIFKNKAQATSKNIQIMILFAVVVIGAPLVFMWLGSLVISSELIWAFFGAFSLAKYNFWWCLGSIVSIYVVIVSIIKYRQLKDNPFGIIGSFRALHVSEYQDHPLWKRYQNVAEEQAIAASINLPSLYVFKHKQINALVIGSSENVTTVLVSTGALELLDREELAALIAHEYGHIVNGDVSSNLLCVVIVQSLRSLNDVAWRCVSPDGKEFVFSIPSFLLAIILWIVGSFGALAARFMQLWLCRTQEYLADVHSVQFTRNNDALAGVLAKAFMQQNADYNLFYLDHGLANFSHMTFNGMSFSEYPIKKGSWFDTHPPLDQRIERIHPGFLRRFKINNRDKLFKVDPESSIFPQAKAIPLLSSEDKNARLNIITMALFSTDAQENLWQMSFNLFVNEQAIRDDSIDEERLKYWEAELSKVPQLSLIDLRLKLVDGIKKASEVSLLGQINLANIVSMMSGLIVVKNGSEAVLTEAQLSNQLAHVLSAFAKLSHQDKAACQAAYAQAKESYPFISQDKLPLNIIRLVYDLALLSRLSTKDQQKLLGVVGKMIHEDGVISPEEKSLSLLLFRALN